jgi:hypothetical protein
MDVARADRERADGLVRGGHECGSRSGIQWLIEAGALDELGRREVVLATAG